MNSPFLTRRGGEKEKVTEGEIEEWWNELLRAVCSQDPEEEEQMKKVLMGGAVER